MEASIKFNMSDNQITGVETTEDGTVKVHQSLISHKNFKRLQKAILEGVISEEAFDVDKFYEIFYFNPTERLVTLSGRIHYDKADGILRFDGSPLHTDIANFIIKLADDEDSRLGAYVKFLERLMDNPSEHARTELFTWIQASTDLGEKLSITNEGMLLAYKGVQYEDNRPVSRMTGPGYISVPELDDDGVKSYRTFMHNGHLPYDVGNTAFVPRDYVDADVNNGCSRGLHAGTYSYARAWGHGNLLLIEIDPIDVVTIPHCSGHQKIRIARFRSLKTISDPLPESVILGSGAGWTEDEFEMWEDEGLDLEDAEAYEERGFDFDNALEMEKNGGLKNAPLKDEFMGSGHSLTEWVSLDFSLLEVTALVRNDVSFEDADAGDFDASILNEDFDDSEANAKLAEAEKQKRETIKNNVEDAVKRTKKGKGKRKKAREAAEKKAREEAEEQRRFASENWLRDLG